MQNLDTGMRIRDIWSLFFHVFCSQYRDGDPFVRRMAATIQISTLQMILTFAILFQYTAITDDLPSPGSASPIGGLAAFFALIAVNGLVAYRTNWGSEFARRYEAWAASTRRRAVAVVYAVTAVAIVAMFAGGVRLTELRTARHGAVSDSGPILDAHRGP